ncbi:MAG TPA: thioesterase family protein [Thermoanaerobaculia bacterium]
MRIVRTDLRVRYSETDQMGIVYHANYLVWFEIGRTEWCRAAGYPYADMERAGFFIPVTRVEGTFRRSSSYDDPITILTHMSRLSSRGCTFAYAIRDPREALLAEGATDHVFTDADGRACRGSPAILEALARFRSEESEG